ncbi:DUF1573 domain-containing protein [Marinirhabdus gelatinilytica]|uniref:Uncharacterized protein DUF1573 n=1 Tax=Marinirhabdus gelatinilytica TaxID=1703343 RepID=A0A370Q7J0_9FLAO|nr:DUF1573 domain-containing protein [Marinirhabdus gelatinilytica]RDK84324.1 uncharacterized protein DUF1573 [Marinirhabdus gelatinilytica]
MKINLNTVTKGAIVCFLLIATAHVGHAQMTLAKTEAKVAIIDFDVETLDYGKIAQNSDGTRTISFTNTGDAPLVISEVKSSCGCTVPTYSKAPILPNATGEITVKYNTSKVGAFTKKITVLSNATEASKVIRIKGVVVK